MKVFSIASKKVGHALLCLHVTFSDKSTVVSRRANAARQLTRALQRMHIPAKHAKRGLDSGALFTGGGAPSKANQTLGIHSANLRARRTSTACKFDFRVCSLAAGSVQPSQTSNSASASTSAKKMKSNMAAAIYGWPRPGLTHHPHSLQDRIETGFGALRRRRCGRLLDISFPQLHSCDVGNAQACLDRALVHLQG